MQVSQNTDTPLLTAKNLVVSYGGRFQLGPVNIELFKGKHTAILGPSGSGKSTLLRALTGQVVPTEGAIYVESTTQNLANQLLLGYKGIHLVQQDLALPAFQKVISTFQRSLAHLPQPVQNEEISRLSTLFNVNNFLYAKPEELSQGQQQRCAIALAFTGSPKVVALDEPFSHQDAWQRQQLLEAIRACSEHEDGCTLVLCTHSIIEAKYLCNSSLYLSEGKVVSQGNFSELQSQSIPAVQALFGWVSSHDNTWIHWSKAARKSAKTTPFWVEKAIQISPSQWVLVGKTPFVYPSWAISHVSVKEGKLVHVYPFDNK